MEHLKNYLLSSVMDNILPITSVCNVSCVFCSHRQNPPGIESFFLPPLAWAELEDMVEFLTPERKVVIGESTTRIMEGEPFTHPRFLDLLRLIRHKLPATPIQITTNGTLLNKTIIRELKKLEPLEVIISLNSACPEKRAVLMGSNRSAEAIQAVESMAQEGLAFHGSIVPLPWLTEWEDLANTLTYLDKFQAQTIRLFRPGFTRYRQEVMGPTPEWEEALRAFVEDYRLSCSTPLTLEPAGLKDLRANITGVIKGSQAFKVGLKYKQEIIGINGQTPFSRVAAFYQLSKPGKYILKVRKEQEELATVELELSSGEKSGLVMDYDLDPGTVEKLRRGVDKAGAAQPLMLASEWGEPLLKAGFRQAGLEPLAERVLAVQNQTFGGNIKAAGLLLVNDFRSTLSTYLSQGGTADLLLLPALAFDAKGRDLRGIHYLSLEEACQIKVQLV